MKLVQFVTFKNISFCVWRLEGHNFVLVVIGRRSWEGFTGPQVQQQLSDTESYPWLRLTELSRYPPLQTV